MMINKKAQNITEYAIILGLITTALLLMSTYFQRGIRVVIKEPVDHLGGLGSSAFGSERIQEIGIEHNIDPDFAKSETPQPFYSRSSFNKSQTITASLGGKRTKQFSDKTITYRFGLRSAEETGTEQYRKIRYDQISDD